MRLACTTGNPVSNNKSHPDLETQDGAAPTKPGCLEIVKIGIGSREDAISQDWRVLF